MREIFDAYDTIRPKPINKMIKKSNTPATATIIPAAKYNYYNLSKLLYS